MAMFYFLTAVPLDISLSLWVCFSHLYYERCLFWTLFYTPNLQAETFVLRAMKQICIQCSLHSVHSTTWSSTPANSANGSFNKFPFSIFAFFCWMNMKLPISAIFDVQKNDHFIWFNLIWSGGWKALSF